LKLGKEESNEWEREKHEKILPQRKREKAQAQGLTVEECKRGIVQGGKKSSPLCRKK